MSMTTLVCSCGMTLNAAGAKPGRVGKCPKCGSLLRVSDDFIPPEPASPTLPPPPPAKPTLDGSSAGYGMNPIDEARPLFYDSPTLAAPAARIKRRAGIPADYGPLKAPGKIEKEFSESLGYPLWSWSSVALILFLPPFLLVVSAPLPFLMSLFFGTTPFRLPSVFIMIPSALAGVFVWGYTLIYLGNVLTSSAFGEPLPPRAPNLEEGVFRVLGRWFWAILSGVLLGFAPAIVYWINCGEINWLDRIMFANLAAVGAAYAQMALLASLLHDDPLAANPVTVFRAMYRVGWDYAGVCFMSGAFLVFMAFSLGLISEVDNGFFYLVLALLYWAAFLYGAMVVLRRLGLFCHRHKVVLAWFADRPTWGR
jgi:hypothetical protein